MAGVAVNPLDPALAHRVADPAGPGRPGAVGQGRGGAPVRRARIDCVPDSTTMRVLVTGGAGFIGANFVHHTSPHRPDVEVTVLDALTYAGERGEPRRRCATASSSSRGDVADAALVDPLVAEADVVVHFAAESHNDNSLRDPSPFVHTNIVGTFTILEAVRRHGVRLHHISTDEVYGDLELDDPAQVHARHPVQPVEPVQRRRRPAPTCWCAPGCARSASPPRSRTARTTTARTSTSRSSSRARSPTCSPACGPSCTAPARTCATGSTSTTTTPPCGRSSTAAGSARPT